MQQGDCNAHATMMRAMNFLFRNIKDLMIYLDDMLIANHTHEEQINTIRAVMKLAKDNKLWFNKNKHQFMPARMQIFGNILTDQGLEAHPDKIDGIMEFPKLGNQRQLERFLGMANYLRQFCQQLGSVAAPLSELQGATKHWKWTHLHDVSFEGVKTLIMTNKVLKPINPDPSQRIYLVCNLSDTGIAGWIGQQQEDGLIRPARFNSRKFIHLQMNYGVTKKELFAKVDSVRHFRGVLQGHPLTIVTDYKPLTGFLKSLQTNPMLISWQESLSQLDTTIEYREGKQNVIADAFSRIFNPIKIPSRRDSLSPPDNRHGFTAQLPVITTHLKFSIPYLHLPLPTITSYTTMPSQTNNRITTSNSTRRYDEDDTEY